MEGLDKDGDIQQAIDPMQVFQTKAEAMFYLKAAIICVFGTKKPIYLEYRVRANFMDKNIVKLE